MASVTLDASLVELANSLLLEKVPEKLHCAACHNFNINAYKASCCDESICESCFIRACDTSCPKCDHKPFTTDTCKPHRPMRNTVKSWLKTQEKIKSDEQAKAVTTDEVPPTDMVQESVNGEGQEEETTAEANIEQAVDEDERITAGDVQPSIEDHDIEEAAEHLDDDIEIHVDLDDDHREIPLQPVKSGEVTPIDQSAPPSGPKAQARDQSSSAFGGMGGMDFSHTTNGFNNMDMNQMMQMMAANGMGGFNPMMGMPMGVNSMSTGMFGGFGVSNGGMTGMNAMNMGMNFNPNQGMLWNNQNSMWQNNNANAFPNAMGGDFGSNYGFNTGNFQQANSNGDFQSGYYGRGYGRGRGRGRGGYGRGRGNFQQHSQYHQQGYYNGPEQQNLRPQTGEGRPNGTMSEQKAFSVTEDTTHDDDEFAPGGQEEVQEALGDDYQKTVVEDKKAADEAAATADNVSVGNEPDEKNEDGDEAQVEKFAQIESIVLTTETDRDLNGVDQARQVPEAYGEDLNGPMPPPSAPLGPSAQYGGRGHGRFSSRGRGSISMPNGHLASSVKPFTPPVEPKGVGVVGAPTGPRAMREPPAAPAPPSRPESRASGTGFQIMGRASMTQARRSESRDGETVPNRDADVADGDRSRRQSRQDSYANSRQENDEQEYYDARDNDKRYRKTKRTTYDEYDGDEQEPSRSDSADRKASHRSRGDKDKSSKYRSSRSKRYEEADANGDHEMEDHDDSTRSARDDYYAESRSKHRSSKSSKHDDRERERDRDRDRRDKDRDRDDKSRDRDRDKDRDRKRSRHDRHRDEGKDYNYDYDYEHEDPEQESRHRSRRHKKDHRRDTEDGSAAASNTNERTSHRPSASTTPAATARASNAEAEKDPHTLEREARNRERMLKEQQRRENAAKGGGSARRVTYKYEDELERGLVEGERASARWR
ncbi:hypothetical protein PV05_07492 [Exophiala xenobiotica]|uniref:RING-type domain-containing protein n=1 Tax=Exophiala xenobiotica TaxID=348802 RepID=A0A0D2F5N1_9EURO|nr:uncharacterized protein PV05_07492 [Exophiala xenobiotica]KIW55189.1 hypothetical protein PV05_07492 [Exophiala xenobiotica]